MTLRGSKVRKIGRLGVIVALGAVLVFAVAWLVLFYTEVGMAKEIGVHKSSLSDYERSLIPQAVLDDADSVARELAGSSQEKFQDLVDQLLATYVEAKDTDVVVIFNSGGWGWNLLEDTPGWASIIDGIKSKLDESGYRTLLLNYQRTSHGFRGILNEFKEAVTRYPSKAIELADRVQFLTAHNPDLTVIVAGESTGTVITDQTMNILRDNDKVYSIQTGNPFWHKASTSVRTLLMNSNGSTIDTFSYGKISAMILATVKGWFGLMGTEEDPGTILSWLRAPGHDYSWQYPGICSAVLKFLDANFEQKIR